MYRVSRTILRTELKGNYINFSCGCCQYLALLLCTRRISRSRCLKAELSPGLRRRARVVVRGRGQARADGNEATVLNCGALHRHRRRRRRQAQRRVVVRGRGRLRAGEALVPVLSCGALRLAAASSSPGLRRRRRRHVAARARARAGGIGIAADVTNRGALRLAAASSSPDLRRRREAQRRVAARARADGITPVGLSRGARRPGRTTSRCRTCV